MDKLCKSERSRTSTDFGERSAHSVGCQESPRYAAAVAEGLRSSAEQPPTSLSPSVLILRSRPGRCGLGNIWQASKDPEYK
jgi:hypothetical protein